MQKLWEVQPQGLVLVLHPGQVQLCNCNNLKVAESTNWIKGHELLMVLGISKPLQPQRISQSSASADTCHDVEHPVQVIGQR